MVFGLPFLLVFAAQDSKPGSNQYGPNKRIYLSLTGNAKKALPFLSTSNRDRYSWTEKGRKF
jgi:hypothetical protein